MGSNQATLSYATAALADSGEYRVIVSNAAGSVTSGTARVLVGNLPANATYTWSNFVGTPGGGGSLDGVGRDAQLFHPNQIIAAGSGKFLIRDDNDLRQLQSKSVLTTMTTSLQGSLTSDAAGNVHATNRHAIWKMAPNGTITLHADVLFVKDRRVVFCS